MPQILPASVVRPSPSSTWQYLFAGTLFLFTFGSCVQLGLAANVHLLPKVWTSSPPPSLNCACLPYPVICCRLASKFISCTTIPSTAAGWLFIQHIAAYFDRSNCPENPLRCAGDAGLARKP